jgi:hypothetical protein
MAVAWTGSVDTKFCRNTTASFVRVQKCQDCDTAYPWDYVHKGTGRLSWYLQIAHQAKVQMSQCLSKRYAMKIGGSGGIAPYILNLDTRWSWVISFTPHPLKPRGKTLCTHRTGGCMGPTAGLDAAPRRKKIPSLPLPGIELRSSRPYPNHYTRVYPKVFGLSR